MRQLFSRQRYLTTLRHKHNGSQFVHGILNFNLCVKLLNFHWYSLQFVANGPIIDGPALFLVMSWRQVGAKPLFEPILVYRSEAYTRYSTMMS